MTALAIRRHGPFILILAGHFLLGAAYTLREGAHIRIDLFYGRLAPRARAWMFWSATSSRSHDSSRPSISAILHRWQVVIVR